MRGKFYKVFKTIAAMKVESPAYRSLPKIAPKNYNDFAAVGDIFGRYHSGSAVTTD